VTTPKFFYPVGESLHEGAPMHTDYCSVEMEQFPFPFITKKAITQPAQYFKGNSDIEIAGYSALKRCCPFERGFFFLGGGKK